MNKSWQSKQFRDILNIKHGYPFKGEYFSTEGKYVILTPGNFFEAGGFKRVTAKDKYYLGEFPNEYIHKKNDLIVAMTEQAEGLLGSCALVPEDNLYLHNQRLGHITMNESEVDKKFIYYLFQMKYIRKQIRLTSTGSKVKHTSPERIYDVKLSLPSFKEQQKIAKVLSTLDKKIELNNQINQNLEAMAKTLYDYWFVQFDFPDANGKPYKSSGGKMVYSEELKREIPEGWEVGNLLDIATYTNGLACQKYRPTSDEYLPVIKIREMKDGFTKNTEKVKRDIPEKLIVNDGDILFSWSASLEVIIWTGGQGGLNQHIFKVTSDIYPRSFYYFQLLWYLQHFKMIADLRKTTMGHITQDHLMQSRITIPPLDLVNQLDKKIKPFQEKQILLKQETQKLTQLRDWLLPMLMNGQVSVADATEQVEELMVAEPSVGYGA